MSERSPELCKQVVITVHGMWLNGMEMAVLRFFLRQRGAKTSSFHYYSWRHDMETCARRLHEHATRVADQEGAEKVHFIGHSLGGRVTQRMLTEYSDQRWGSVVALGSPLCGTIAGRELRKFRVGKFWMGSCIGSLQLDAHEPWPPTNPLGSIAGTFPVGAGRIIARINEPSDGVVTVNETRHPSAADYAEIPYNHFGMLWAQQTADLSVNFIRTGSFR